MLSLTGLLFEEVEENMLGLKPGEFLTLNQLYEGNLPDEDEILWEYVNYEDLETPFKVIEINPVFLWYNWKPDGTTPMRLVYRNHATREQKQYIKSLRTKASKLSTSSPVVVMGSDELVDGNHRTAAMALEKIQVALAVDLSQPLESKNS